MADAIIRRPKLKQTIGLSSSSLYDKLNPKSRDYGPDFPKPIKLCKRAVGWRASDISVWLEYGSLTRCI
jgi:prophage regulatory protein